MGAIAGRCSHRPHALCVSLIHYYLQGPDDHEETSLSWLPSLSGVVPFPVIFCFKIRQQERLVTSRHMHEGELTSNLGLRSIMMKPLSITYQVLIQSDQPLFDFVKKFVRPKG